MAQGTIKFFNSQKGFGFITPNEGGKDVFVHVSNVNGDADSLQENTRVQFELGQGKKGPEAHNVVIL